MESYSGLYYPFIHFKNDNWLKMSALYWDKMGRIVPDKYHTLDSDTVRALGSFVETLRPGWVRPQFGESFAQFIQEYGSALRERYGVSRVGEWSPVPVERRPPRTGGSSGTDLRLGYVFYEKMTDELMKSFLDSGLARFDSPYDKQWIGMHPDLALVYMTALADQLAGEHGLSPITDNSVDHIALSGCTVERLAQALLQDVKLVENKANAHEVEMGAALVALETVVPRDLAKVPVDKILKFRQKYPAERGIFQKWVADFIQTKGWLKDIQHQSVFRERVRSEYEKGLKPKVDELREKLHETGIETVRSCINVKALLPAFLPKAAATIGFGLEPITATAAGYVWTIIPILQDKRKKMKEALVSSDVAYLLRTEEELNPASLMNEVKLGLRKFCLGV